jgi:hypothetical protein
MFLVLNPKKNDYRVTRVAPQWRKLQREEVRRSVAKGDRWSSGA